MNFSIVSFIFEVNNIFTKKMFSKSIKLCV